MLSTITAIIGIAMQRLRKTNSIGDIPIGAFPPLTYAHSYLLPT
jgi:hypothetical protein